MAGSTDKGVVDFVRRAVAETATRPLVERGGDFVTLPLGEAAEVRAFGQVLANQSIGVLVGASLPGVVGSGEVDLGSELALDVLVAMELDSVVGSNRADLVCLVREQFDQASVGVFDGSAGQRPDADQAALALHRSDNARFAATVDGVALPVAEAAPAVHDGGPLPDHALASQATAAVVAAIAFAPLLARPAKMTPQRATVLLVPPEVHIDGLMAHDRDACAAAATDDLIRAPLLRDQRFDGREVVGAVARVSTRTAPSSVRHFHRHARAVRPVVGRGIALQFPPNRAAVSSQRGRDRGALQALRAQDPDLISFLRGELSIDHPTAMVHLLPEFKMPNKAPEPTSTSVMPRAILPFSDLKQWTEIPNHA